MEAIADRKNGIFLPIHHRLSEVCDEKGKAFSIRGLAEKTDINRELLRRIFSGERKTILQPEFEAISRALNIPVKRITQDDIRRDYAELEQRLLSVNNPEKALELAEKISAVSIGITERSYSLYHLGRAYFDLHRYSEAHDTWRNAQEYAEAVHKKYGETDILHEIAYKLITSSTKVEEFALIEPLISLVEHTYNEPQHLGTFLHARAKVAEHDGDIETAKLLMKSSLEHYQLTDKQDSIARIEVSVAHYEFETGNLLAAKELLESAIDKLDKDHKTRHIAIKDYGKTLLELGMKNEAAKVVGDALLETKMEPDLHAKMLLLLAEATDNIEYGERVFGIEGVSQEVKIMTYKHLIRLTNRLKNFEKLGKFYCEYEALTSFDTNIFRGKVKF